MWRVYISIGFCLTIAGATLANRIYDVMYNFVPTTATVTGVEHLCYATRHVGSSRKGHVDSLPMQACEPLRQRIASDPSMEGFYVTDQSVVSLQYVSPVDHKTYPGKVGRQSETTVKVDDSVKLFVSLHNPTEFFE